MQGSARIDELRQKFHENPRRYFAPLANEYRKAGDPEQAIAICRAHLAQQPGHMSGHVVYAQSLYDAGRVDESRVVFEKALSLDPDNAIVLRQLGDISRQRGDSAEARHWYSRALEADPHDREIAAYIAELTEPLTDSDAQLEPESSIAAAEPFAATEAASETRVDEPIAVEPIAVEPIAVEPIADEPIAHEPIAHEPVEEIPAEEASVEEIPAAEVPVEEIPSEELPVQEIPSEGAPVEDEPGFDEPDSSTDVEVPLGEPTQEPEVLEQIDEEDVAATPLTTGSPFVTRTMADLYARQGYHEQALEVYRELAAANPDDADVADRIRELSVVSEPAISPVEFSEPSDLDDDLGVQTPGEVEGSPPAPEPQAGSRHFTEIELAPGDQWDTDPWGAGFSSEDGDIVPFDFSPSNALPESSDSYLLENPPGLEDVSAPAAERHDADEASPEAAVPVPVHDAAPGGETEATEVVAAPEAPATPEAVGESEAVAEPDAIAAPEALAQAEVAIEPEVTSERELASASLPLGVLNDAREDISVEEVVAVATASTALDIEEAFAPAEDAVVAYSPQTPDEKDLAHYTPAGPTIREFFATLGAYRPPDRHAQTSFTARAAVPEIDHIEPTAPGSDETDEIWNPAAPESHGESVPEPDAFPLASDAFSSLFPDSPISDEDSKAAFALSGALSSQPPVAPRATPPRPAAAAVAEQAAPAPPAAGAQESEEDIRRFREWLDGLADS